MAKKKALHTRKKKKEKADGFHKKPLKSARLNGRPNAEKTKVLTAMQSAYTEGINNFIETLYNNREYLMPVLLGKKRSPELRALEKKLRIKSLGSALSQSAFDYAVDRCSTQLTNIKNEVYSACPCLLSSSKVLFAMVLQDKSREEMSAKFREIAAGYKDEEKKAFYEDGADEITAMDPEDFKAKTGEIQFWFQVISDSYKIPHVKKAWVQTTSKAGRVSPSESMKAPYVLSVINPDRKGERIEVPLETSDTSARRLSQYNKAASFEWNVREDGLLQVQCAYSKKYEEEPEFEDYRGVDIGIVDMLYPSEGSPIGTFKECIAFYKEQVEPLLGQISTYRNQKAKLKHFLKVHKNLPDDAKKIIRDKMDHLETAIRTAKKAYRKLNAYKGKLAHEIRMAVDQYIKSLNGHKGIVSVVEMLDVNEFNKSKKANGMLSVFARGILTTQLLAALSWAGLPFKEVEPAYTSQCCPVCSYTDKANRTGKQFKCKCCGYKDDADHVGSVNIKARATDKEIDEITQTCSGEKRRKQIKALCLTRNKEWLKAHPKQDAPQTAEAAA